MATITIPVTLDTAAPPTVANVEFDGTEYLLRVAYNLRDAAWYLSLSTTDDTLLVGSQPLVEGYPLFSIYKADDARMPRGDLWFIGASLTYVEAS